MLNIPVFKPYLDEKEIKAVTEAIEMGWLGMGAYVGEFENAVMEYIGASDHYVAAVSTGHAAIHIGLMLMDIGPGDEVITPSFNNIADFQAILATGAKPVFCDIDEKTLCIDLEKAEELVSEKTKVIIAMDYDCHICDHDAVKKFAEKHNLRVMHDAAHAFGSEYKGQKIGTFSDICMFSFDPVKTITTIDGGALVVKTEEELARIHEMRLIGMGQSAKTMYQNKRSWTYDVKSLGFRYHMANLHAAVGLAQLSKIDTIVETRREAGRLYNQKFSEIEEVKYPETDFEGVAPFLYYIRVPEEKRDDLREHLFSHGVDTGIHWQPGHWFSLFQDCRRTDLSVTDKIGHEILSIPFHSDMAEETITEVTERIKEFFYGTNGK